MKLIQDWLNGKRSFTYGTILYNRFGTDENLKELFALGPTPYTIPKLYEALKALAGNAQPSPVIARSEATWKSPEMPASNDKVLKALREKWLPLYTEMNYKRHQLDPILFHNTDAAMQKRARLAMEILQLEQKCMSIWAQRDHYITFGKLPTTNHKLQTETIVEPLALAMQYKNVQSYIRRYRGQLAKNPGNANAAAMLTKYESELQTLKQQLDERR